MKHHLFHASIAVCILFLLFRCTNRQPNPVGSSLFERTDRGSEHFLRIEASSDTTYQVAVNNGSGTRLISGVSGRTKSWSLVSFPMPSTVGVDSANLALTVSSFSNLPTSTARLEIVRAAFAWNESDWTGPDSISTGDPISVQVTPHADSSLTLSLPTDWIASWLDSSVANQGLMIRSLEPDGTIAFYSGETSYGPSLTLYLTGDTTRIDTVLSANADNFTAVSLDAPSDGNLWIANGVAYRSLISFDVDSIPSKAVITRATLRVASDPAVSDSLDVYVFAPTTPTWPPVSGTDDTVISGRIESSGEIEARSLVQAWITGTSNNGLSIWGAYEPSDLGKAVLHDVSADSSLRPALEVYYSLPPENRF